MDRAKKGVKRSLITEGHGVPVGAVIDGANVHGKWLLEPTIDARGFAPPPELWDWAQHLCLDKGYDYPDTREIVTQKGFPPCPGKRRRDGRKEESAPLPNPPLGGRARPLPNLIGRTSGTE